MTKHLFTLMWNKKKQNFLLILEMFVSFLVMFAIFTLVVYYYGNYRKPMGFEYENVWAVNFSVPEEVTKSDSNHVFPAMLKQVVRGVPGIEEAAYSSNNLPFSMSTSNSNLEYKNLNVLAHNYDVDDSYAAVLGLKLTEGRWFQKTEDGLAERPIIINMSLKEKFFPNESATGKVLGTGEDRMKIIGVVQDFKDKGDFQVPDYCVYKRINNSLDYFSSMLVKVKSNADVTSETRLFKQLSNTLKDSNVEIEHLSEKRVTKNKLTLVPMIILLVVGGFLIINVALGLFGVLWYNINKRRGEIGLRRAVGASGNSVTKQLIGEALVLSTFSLILGSFFAVQFPLLNVFDLSSTVYITALVLSIVFIYLLVIFCALYPGKQAAAIYPAVALHEE
jgi:putative ABC transport system permease protein